MATRIHPMGDNTAGEAWGAIQPSVFASTRAILDFGLPRATRNFNEWAFPGIGRVAFVRQFAWGAIGLRLAPQCRRRSHRPTSIAEAREALAAFTALHRDGSYAESNRIRGERKLADDSDDFSYGRMRNRTNYVSQPFRMGTTAGLVGCGLATGPAARFDQLQLTDDGARLADTLLNRPLGVKSPGRTVRSWLLEKWIEADGDWTRRIPAAVRDALLPTPRKGELGA